jgi:hypothetical protein
MTWRVVRTVTFDAHTGDPGSNVGVDALVAATLGVASSLASLFHVNVTDTCPGNAKVPAL